MYAETINLLSRDYLENIIIIIITKNCAHCDDNILFNVVVMYDWPYYDKIARWWI